jgi:hypothetical protein
VRHACLVAQRGKAVERAGTHDLEPAGAIEHLDERAEGTGLARLPEGPGRLRLHQIARVPHRQRLYGERRLVRLEVTQGLDDRAADLRVRRAHGPGEDLEALPRAQLSERPRAFRARPPERLLVEEHTPEGVDGRRVVGAHQRLRGKPAPAPGGSP